MTQTEHGATDHGSLALWLYLGALGFVLLGVVVTLLFGLGGVITLFTLSAWVILAFIVVSTAGN